MFLCKNYKMYLLNTPEIWSYLQRSKTYFLLETRENLVDLEPNQRYIFWQYHTYSKSSDTLTLHYTLFHR